VVFRDPLLVDESTTVKPGLRPDFTPREHEALVALCRPFFSANLVKKAASVKEMESELFVGKAAVQMHLSNLYRKFLIPDEATDKRDLLAIAVIEAGIVGHGDYTADAREDATG
jgi:hypothetical protein